MLTVASACYPLVYFTACKSESESTPWYGIRSKILCWNRNLSPMKSQSELKVLEFSHQRYVQAEYKYENSLQGGTHNFYLKKCSSMLTMSLNCHNNSPILHSAPKETQLSWRFLLKKISFKEDCWSVNFWPYNNDPRLHLLTLFQKRKMYMTLGQGQWPGVTGKNGLGKVAFLLKKSVQEVVLGGGMWCARSARVHIFSSTFKHAVYD